jgi:hypothetical protein
LTAARGLVNIRVPLGTRKGWIEKMNKKFMTALALVLAFGLVAYGQLSGDFAAGPTKDKPKFSLLDPARLHMSQSYSFWYSSSRAGSNNLAMYLNSIEYQISDPLKIRVDIGYIHQPGAILKNGTKAFENGQIVPGLSLTWRPSRNFLFQLDYRQVPILGDRYNRDYYDGSWGDR